MPAGAPTHRSVGLDAVHGAGRRTTLLVAAPELPDADLLERLDDARRRGATLFALHPGDSGLAHESLTLPEGVADPFDTAGHVVVADLPDRADAWLRRALRVGA